MTEHGTLEHDGERENPRPLDLHSDFTFALPCLEAVFRAEDETIVDVSGDNPHGQLAPPTETSDIDWSYHVKVQIL